jgi:hypothetical protein
MKMRWKRKGRKWSPWHNLDVATAIDWLRLLTR